jgi:hypothetical protein
MKLAEALLERADLKKKLMLLNTRILNNARMQEGCEPTESEEKLLKELDELLKRLEYLIKHINYTKEVTKSKNGEKISELIAKKDVLALKLKSIASLVDAGGDLVNRMTRSEIKILPTFDVAAMQKKVDHISGEIRKVDTAIQELNWTTELL